MIIFEERGKSLVMANESIVKLWKFIYCEKVIKRKKVGYCLAPNNFHFSDNFSFISEYFVTRNVQVFAAMVYYQRCFPLGNKCS